jgi:hypothetical protein
LVYRRKIFEGVNYKTTDWEDRFHGRKGIKEKMEKTDIPQDQRQKNFSSLTERKAHPGRISV